MGGVWLCLALLSAPALCLAQDGGGGGAGGGPAGGGAAPSGSPGAGENPAAPVDSSARSAADAPAGTTADPLPQQIPPGAVTPGSNSPSAWTMERATQVAEERSPAVQAANAALGAARAYRSFGKVPRVGNPIVNLRAMVGRPDDPAATYSAFLGLPVDVSGRRRAWRREASFVEREAEARLAMVKNEARADARDAFIDTALSSARLKVARDNAETAREFLSRVKARFDARAATALDMALSERDYAEAVANAASAEAMLAESLGRFRQVLDLPPSEAVETAPLEAPQLPAELSLERAVELAQARRQDPAVFRAGASRFEAAQTRLRREAVAPLVLGGEYEVQGNRSRNSSGGVQLGMELPILFRNQGERAVARGESQVQGVQAELTDRRVGREAVTAYQQLEAALSELTTLDREAAPAAERALAMTMEMLDVGAIDYFRLLNARQMAFGLRARRVEAMRLAWRRRIALERAMGGSLEAP